MIAQPMLWFDFRDAHRRKWHVYLSTLRFHPILTDCYGYTSTTPRQIVLDARYSWDRVMRTLRHELGHASVDDRDDLDPEAEEAAVTLLSVPFTQMLARPPFKLQFPPKPKGFAKFRRWALMVDPIE